MCVMCAAVVNTGDCWFSQIGPVRATLLETTDAPGIVPGTTPYSISVGDAFQGGLTALDADLIAITLTAGQQYQFLLGGRGTTPSLDTFLELYAANGQLLGFDDDGGGNLRSLLRFTPTESGTYLLRVSTFDGSPGQYQLAAQTAQPLPVASLDTMARFLTDGFWTNSNQQRHAFDTTGGNEITFNISGLTMQGQFLALAAMEAWEMVANVNFRVVASGAEITFDDASAGAFATYVASGNRTLSAQVNVSTDWLRDYGSAYGTYGFQTYVHEVGHALGLGHQGPYNASASFGLNAIFANDSTSLSIMSYFDQDQNPNDPGSFAFLLTPMMADIVAIQSLYGAPVGGVTAGNTVWGEGSTLTNFLGDFFRAEFGWAGAMQGIALTIYDESGRDRVVFSTDTTNQSVRLEGEARWNVFGGLGNVNVARGTVIEDYTAGSGNDTVTGNGVANLLVGNAGLDVLSGMAGNDTLDGGAGNDTLNGGTGVDRLVGGAGNDVYILADAGDVVVEAAGGGTDRVNSALSHVLAANVEHLTLTGSAVVNGTGNALANLLTGNAMANSLVGGAGNDTLNGGDGNDTLNGGADLDRLVGGAGNDIYVLGDAGDAVIEAVGGGTDVVQSSLSHVLAANVDHLQLTGSAAVNGTGNGLANRLVGNAAANTLSGGVGNDTLNGGAGNDVLTGGSGDDAFIFGFNAGRDRITDFQDNIDSLRIDDQLLGAGAATWDGLAAVGRAFSDRVEFHFAPDQVLTVFGVTQVAQLADDYAFI